MQPERLKNWRQLCLNSLQGINQVNWAIPPKYLKTEIPSRCGWTIVPRDLSESCYFFSNHCVKPRFIMQLRKHPQMNLAGVPKLAADSGV